MSVQRPELLAQPTRGQPDKEGENFGHQQQGKMAAAGAGESSRKLNKYIYKCMYIYISIFFFLMFYIYSY